jgi:hypothetical protein
MSRHRTAIALLVAVAGMAIALSGLPRAGADEDEEKPITSSAAQISRDSAGHVFIAIRPPTQKEIGITTEVLKPVVRPIEIEAYGFVLDPAPLSKLNSDLLSAQGALAAADAQYRRTSRLYAEQKNASQRDLQSAQATYVTDKSQLEALEEQLRNDWGEEITQMDPRDRAHLVSALVDRREAIARVTAPTGEQIDDATHTAQVVVLGQEEHPLKARAVYDAPTVVPSFQGQTFLVLLATAGLPVRPGTAVSAHIPTSRASERGVMVPRSAVMRYAGNEWVYLELGSDRFARIEIVPAEITDRGYFVTENLAPGARIVVTGAETLLSEELKGQIEPED